MPDPLLAVGTRTTPQSRPADTRQVANSAGGYTFRTSDETQIRRFLTIGTEGGTYYITEAELTRKNAGRLIEFARTNGERLVEMVLEISEAGRAPRQKPGLFALAAVAGEGSDEAKVAALAAIPRVCRTGTTLFQFVTYLQLFRGWSTAVCRAVARWYLEKDVDQLAYQMVKYRQRDGWTHRDVLRKAHPKTDDVERDALLHWAVSASPHLAASSANAPVLVRAFIDAQASTAPTVWTSLIENTSLPWEALPDAALTKPKVWRALIDKGMPQTALLRQLPRLTRLGVLDGSTLATVTAQLTDAERLRKARVHPINVLVAQRTYAAGQGTSSSWEPNRKVVDALDAAFYAAYGAIEPANKRTLYALDVSGSMGSPVLSGGQRRPNYGYAQPGQLSCREAAAALALVTLATEPDTEIVGFTSAGGGYGGRWGGGSSTLTPLDITPRRRLDDVVKYTADLPFGGTDCALPFVWADAQRKDFDTGSVHPHQALRKYRDAVGHDVKSIVVGLAANDFTIADPSDPSSLDVAGLASAVPNLIADFSRGDV
jgi:60 kDa SS-A/Ro ribonucleoprotein